MRHLPSVLSVDMYLQASVHEEDFISTLLSLHCHLNPQYLQGSTTPSVSLPTPRSPGFFDQPTKRSFFIVESLKGGDSYVSWLTLLTISMLLSNFLARFRALILLSWQGRLGAVANRSGCELCANLQRGHVMLRVWPVAGRERATRGKRFDSTRSYVIYVIYLHRLHLNRFD
jgi:hypothetical protein